MFHLPDGYTVEDIVLSWEDDNAIHITDELHIPQYTYLGRQRKREKLGFDKESTRFGRAETKSRYMSCRKTHRTSEGERPLRKQYRDRTAVLLKV